MEDTKETTDSNVTETEYEMTAEHKEKLAEGRREALVVKKYLEALEDYKPKRGRPRSLANVEARIGEITEEVKDPELSPIKRLELLAERENLEAELQRLRIEENLEEYEDEFVQVARSYSDRKDISYSVWREAGVPAKVLKRANITRS